MSDGSRPTIPLRQSEFGRGLRAGLGRWRKHAVTLGTKSSADGTWAAARGLDGHARLSHWSGAAYPRPPAGSTAPHNRGKSSKKECLVS